MHDDDDWLYSTALSFDSIDNETNFNQGYDLLLSTLNY